MAKNDLRIDVLGTDFTISTDEEAEYLKRLLEKYRHTVENVQRLSGLKDPLKIAVLTGFLLCDDLEKAAIAGFKNANEETEENAENDENAKKAEELTLSLISRLDALPLNLSRKPDLSQSGEKPLEEYSGTSRIKTEGEPLLCELINRNKTVFPGLETAKRYGNLPFLFKLFTASKPNFIKVNSNPQPKIICALGPLTVLCGLRKPEEISFFMDILRDNAEFYYRDNNRGETQDSGEELKAVLENLVSALANLSNSENDNPLRTFCSLLFGSRCEALRSFLKTQSSVLEKDFPEYSTEWKLCSYLANLEEKNPQDPAVIAPLYLNIIELKAGEAINLPSGIFHACIHGLGLELTSNSGHTSEKEISGPANFSAYKPEIIRAPSTALSWFSYPALSENFTLSVMRDSRDSILYFENGPSIVLLTEGEVIVSKHGNSNAESYDSGIPLMKGESLFVPAGTSLLFWGNFTAYAAAAKT